MTSEEASIVSDQPSELGSDQGQWVSKSEAAFREGVSERTIETRIKAEYYPSRLSEGRREVFLKNRKPAPKPSDPLSELLQKGSEQTSDTAPKYIGNTSEAHPNTELIAKMIALADKVLDVQAENSKLAQEVEQKKSELTVMNNERASYNTSLQKANEDRKENSFLRGEVETLRRENEALKKQLEEAKRHPGWMFWKS